MKTEQEIQQAIIKIASIMESQFPEMAKYIGKAPVPESPDILSNLNKLRSYHNSIENFMIYYSRYQERTKTGINLNPTN
jgi:hypothetical protein